MEYRREIDGLRAVAVLPVILFHAGLPWFSGGYVGVDVFFVISGYLITSILLDGLESKSFSFATFYERRARRILPALFFVMLSCVPLAWITMLPSQFKGFSESMIAVSMFSSNIYFWFKDDYFSQPSEELPLLHTWSLGVEEQFYVLFPMFLFVLWRHGTRTVLYGICAISVLSLLLSEYGWRNFPSANFYLLPTRAWELGFGAICAFLLKGRSMPIGSWPAAIGLAMIMLSIVAYDDTTPFPSLYALAPVVGTVLIILFGSRQTLVGKVLSNKFLVGIGLISFSAYLWHQPIFAFARIAGGGETPKQEAMIYLSTLSLLLAYLTYRYIETPFRITHQGSFAVSREAIFYGSTVVAMGFVCFGLVSHISGDFRTQFNDKSISIDNASRDRSMFYRCESKNHHIVPVEKACSIGSTRNIVAALVGDSHATALTEQLDKVAREEGVGIKILTYSGCSPAIGLERDGRYCDAVNQRNIAFIKESGIPYVIMAARWALYHSGKRFDNGEGGVESGERPQVFPVDRLHSNDDGREFVLRSYRNTINSYLKSGIHVVLVWNIPEAGWNVPQYLAAAYRNSGQITATVGSTSYSAYQLRTNATHSVFLGIVPSREMGSLIHIKPGEYLCNTEISGRCITHADGAPLYFDDDHLSNKGAAILAPVIAKVLNGSPPPRGALFTGF